MNALTPTAEIMSRQKANAAPRSFIRSTVRQCGQRMRKGVIALKPCQRVNLSPQAGHGVVVFTLGGKSNPRSDGIVQMTSRNLSAEGKLVRKVISRRRWITILLTIGCLGTLVWFISNRGEVTVTITGIDHSSKPPRLMIVVHNGTRRPVTLGYISGYVRGRLTMAAELDPPIPGEWGSIRQSQTVKERKLVVLER